MRRFLRMAQVKPEAKAYYIERHANPPAALLRALCQAHIQNYSIAEKDGLLISYFEYTGADFDADMRALDADPASAMWNEVLSACFVRHDEGCWQTFREVFYLDGKS